MGLEDINPNRGLIQKPLPGGGPCISQVKSEPGVYYDATGEICPDEMAEQAGFDVKAGKREKAKREAIAKQTAAIEEKFREEASEIENMSDAELEEKGIVEPGSLVDTAPSALEPGDGSPFVTKTTSGEPRVCRAAKDGPVKMMEYVQRGRDSGWSVIDRDSGKVYGKGLDKDKATKLLLEE